MEVEQYFSLNHTPEVSKATIWETHKAYIRGKLISLGAGKKKEREIKMKNTVKELYDLKQKHKTQLDTETQQKIIIKRGQLNGMMEQETRKIFKT